MREDFLPVLDGAQKHRLERSAEQACRMVDREGTLPKAEAEELKKFLRGVAKEGQILAKMSAVRLSDRYNFELSLEPDRASPDIGLNRRAACQRMFDKIAGSLRPAFWSLQLQGTRILLKSKASRPAQPYTGACKIPAIRNELVALAHKIFSYDVSDPDFHRYGHATPLCRETPKGKCSIETAYKLLQRFPAPMIDGFETASEDRPSVLTVGAVSHKLLQEHHALINYTLEGEHMLHPGAVLRKIVRHDGFLYVGTYGEGTAKYGDPFGFLACVNESQAPQVWGGVDRAIVAALATMR
jgi:hypothetical protein